MVVLAYSHQCAIFYGRCPVNITLVEKQTTHMCWRQHQYSWPALHPPAWPRGRQNEQRHPVPCICLGINLDDRNWSCNLHILFCIGSHGRMSSRFFEQFYTQLIAPLVGIGDEAGALQVISVTNICIFLVVTFCWQTYLRYDIL